MAFASLSSFPASLLNLAQHYHWDKESLLGRQGLRIGDRLTWLPFNGHQRSFTLNRTYYQIISGESFQYDSATAVLTLPSTAQETFRYQLRLINPASLASSSSSWSSSWPSSSTAAEEAEPGRYVLLAEEMPFRLNQAFSFCSFLERGDEIMLGFNKLYCAFAASNEDCGAPHPILGQHRFIQSDLPLVISGEPGTGKRRLAALVHQNSGRQGGYLEVNTPADLPRPSLVHDMTLVVRTALPPLWPLLQKLLSLSDRHPAVARLIVLYDYAFHKTPPVAEKWDSEILTFLGRGQKVFLEPLRQHPAWIRAYCQNFGQKYHLFFTPRLLQWYERYTWPGNFQELENHLQLKRQSSPLAKIDFDELDAPLIAAATADREGPLMGRPWPLKFMEQQYLAQVFFASGNQRRKTAQLLGITENTVRRILKKMAARNTERREGQESKVKRGEVK